MLESESAWSRSDGDGIVVAVIDTGVDINHEDLQNQIWTNEYEIPNNGIDDDGNGYADDLHGYDFSDDAGSDPAVFLDPNGHGTHVAGTIAAEGNNEKGIIGVSPKAKIMPVRVLDDDGYGYPSNIAEGIYYAVNNGADVINMSLGGARSDSSIVEEIALDYAYAEGCIVVAAAGNSNMDASSFTPACHEYSIAVAAIDANRSKASFSNYGTVVDIAAPGVGVLSCLSDGSSYESTYASRIIGQKYLWLNGTSMAAPHVAGVTALLLSASPNLTYAQIKNILQSSSVDNEHNYSSYAGLMGSGIVNAKNALEANSVVVYPDGPAICRIVETGVTFSVLQLALNAVSQNQTIEIYAGTHTGTGNYNLVWPNVDNVTLQGASSIDTVLDAEGLNKHISVMHPVNLAITDLSLISGYSQGVGGSLYMGLENNPSFNLTISDVVLSGNQAQYGGALGFPAGSTNNATLVNCKIANNTGNYGGAVSYGNIIFNNSKLHSNSANYGGNVYQGTTTINNCLFFNNIADQGAVSYGGSSVVINTTVYENTASEGGCFYGGDHILINTVLYDNSSETGSVFSEARSLTLVNCTVVSNDGAMINASSVVSSFRGYNTIIAGDFDKGHNNSFIDFALNRCALTDTTIPASVTTTNLINSFNASQFEGYEVNNYRLISSSVGIDAGVNVLWDNNSSNVTNDIEGNSRITGNYIDIGAYESTYSSETNNLDQVEIVGVCKIVQTGATYNTIQEALDVVIANQTIEVFHGVHSGDGNYDLAWPNRDNVTLQGVPGAYTVIDAEGLGRHIYLESAANINKMNIKNLILRNGNSILCSADSGHGGSIHLDEDGNTVTNFVLEMIGVTLEKNNATYGGAFRSYEMYTISMNNCIIFNNSAKYGGTIYGAKILFYNCILASNRARTGGVVWQGSASFINSDIYNNSAINGGVAYRSINEFDNSNIYSNSSEYWGGAFYEGENHFTSCNIFDNSVSKMGGGVFYKGKNIVTQSNIYGNTSFGSIIGAVFFRGQNLLTSCDVFDNSTTLRGGVFSEGHNTLNYCNIYRNSAGSGAVFGHMNIADAGNFVLTNCNLFENSASGGGGVSLWGEYSYINCNIYNNIAEQSGGVASGGINRFSSCNVYENKANGLGGAFYGGENVFTSSNIYSNSCNGEGGAFRFGTAALNNCAVYENKSDSYGGAFSGGNYTVINSNIYGNSARLGGGAFGGSSSLGEMGNNTIINSCIYNNISPAGSVFFSVSSNKIVNCTIVSNDGAILYNGFSTDFTFDAYNSIFVGDFSGGYKSKYNQSQLLYCAVSDEALPTQITINHSVNGFNINQFMNYSEANYSLVTNSIGHDAGSTVLWNVHSNNVLTDISGANRIFGNSIDLGCYEIQTTRANNPPIISANPVIVVDEGEAATIDAYIYDADSDPLQTTYYWNSPTGAISVSSVDGKLMNSVGTWNIDILVTDGEAWVSTSVMVIVIAVESIIVYPTQDTFITSNIDPYKGTVITVVVPTSALEEPAVLVVETHPTVFYQIAFTTTTQDVQTGADIVSYDFLQAVEISLNAVDDGSPVLINTFLDVEISLSPSISDTRDIRVYYYDSVTETWLNDGITILSVNFDSIVFRTTHLTYFSVVKLSLSNQPPTISLSSSAITINETETVAFTWVVSDPDGDNVNVTISGWITTSNYQTIIGDAGEHFVTVSATDGQSTTNATLRIFVQPQKSFSDIINVIAWPNPFNPNNQQINIKYTTTEDNSGNLRIFTIYGRELKNISFSGCAGDNVLTWDGRDKAGNMLSSDLYVYLLQVKGVNGTTATEKGKIVIWR